MWNNAQDAYLENRILSADPLELVRLLYQAAMAAVKEARRGLAAGEIVARSRAISMACEIVIELNAALDPSRGGDLAPRLAALYDYMLGRLLDANMQQNDAPLAEVAGLLSTLSEAWEQTVTPVAAVMPQNPWSIPQQAGPAHGSQVWSL